MILKVNGRDLSHYVRVAHDEGLDPSNAERVDPQFAGSTAFRDGMEFVKDATGNREMAFPLILMTNTTAALHELIRDINDDCFRGSRVEFALNDTDPVTVFDMEAGRIEDQFEFWLARNGKLRCVLRIWAQPHGNTGTARTVAQVSGTGPQSFPVTGIAGDVDSLGKMEVRVGSKVASSGRVIGIGIHSHPSFNAFHTASDGQTAAQASSTVVGASGAVASKYYAIPVSPTGASGIALTDYLTPAPAHVGRHRVFAVARSGLSLPIPLYAKDRFGAVLGPTAQATQTDQTKWQLIDLGEINVPARASGQESVPTQYVNLYGGGASGAAVVASPALHLCALKYLPLDQSPGLLRTDGAGGNAQQLYADSFDRVVDTGLFTTWGNADSGQTWLQIAGAFGAIYGLDNVQRYSKALFVGTYSNVTQVQGVANASALAALASGAFNQDLYGEIHVGLKSEAGQSASGGASGLLWEFWPKAVTNGSTITSGVGVRLSLPSGMPALSIWAASGGATSLIASANASSAAAGIWAGKDYRLAVLVQGPTAQVFMATGGLGAAALTAGTSLGIAGAGWPALRANNAGVASVYPYMDSLVMQYLGASALDIGAREYFRFESHPEERAVQANASAFVANCAAEFRGRPPRIPNAGASAAASGPARAIVFEGEIDNWLGSDVIDIRLDVVERFTFLR